METKEFLIAASVNNKVAVLNKITAAFLKRHINIESLNVSESHIEGISTMVITSVMTEETMRLLIAHLDSLFDVVHVACYNPEDIVNIELALYKISTQEDSEENRTLLRNINGSVIEHNDDYIILEKSGSRVLLENIRLTLEKQNMLLDYSRSGNVVLHKDPLENFYDVARLSMAI